jgi:hypothetical protein
MISRRRDEQFLRRLGRRLPPGAAPELFRNGVDSGD